MFCQHGHEMWIVVGKCGPGYLEYLLDDLSQGSYMGHLISSTSSICYVLLPLLLVLLCNGIWITRLALAISVTTILPWSAISLTHREDGLVFGLCFSSSCLFLISSSCLSVPFYFSVFVFYSAWRAIRGLKQYSGFKSDLMNIDTWLPRKDESNIKLGLSSIVDLKPSLA